MSDSALHAAVAADDGVFEETAPPAPFVALQRVCVRLLFDPEFVERVYGDPAAALAGLDLPEDLVRQLLSNDRRLWGADRLRRHRALKVLLEEFKASSALALSACRRLALLERFFSSPFFHRAVQRRGYMALAFRDYLRDAAGREDLSSPALENVLLLEGSMAWSRRALREARRGRDRRQGPGGHLRTRPGVTSVEVAGGTLAVVQHVESYLFEAGLVPVLALCDDAPRPEPLPRLDRARPEHYLLEPRPGGKVDLSAIPARFHPVIRACVRPRSRGDVARSVRVPGCDARKVGELVDALCGSGVLVATEAVTPRPGPRAPRSGTR